MLFPGAKRIREDCEETIMASQKMSTEDNPRQRFGLPGLRLKNGRSLPIEFIARLQSGSRVDLIERWRAERQRKIDFAHLPDGTLLDLVRNHSGELAFAVLQNGTSAILDTVKLGDVRFITPDFHLTRASAIRFPTTVGGSHTARELLREIEDVIESYYDCDPLNRKLLAHFALYTWTSDLSAVAVYLWIIGSYGRGKTTLLRIMSAMCRRAMLVGDVSIAGLYRLNTELHPTLLIDESDMGHDSRSRDFLRLLRVGSTNGQAVLRATGVYDPFGPKIIASRAGLGDAPLASRGFYVVARPLSRSISVLTTSALESIAEQLQPKLMAFRLNNYSRLGSVSASAPQCVGSSPRAQDIGRALLLPIDGDKELESQLFTILEVHGQQVAVEHDTEPEFFLAIVLMHLSHVRGPGAPVHWTAKELAQQVRSCAAARGESHSPTPRKVGEILRSLGLRTHKLGALGRGLINSKELSNRVHEIAKGLGICAGDLFTPGFADTPASCESCERYGLNFDNSGRKIPYQAFDFEPDAL
jgi:hypothetical protein